MSDYRRWSEQEDKFLKEAIKNGCRIRQIARILDRGESAVEHRCRKLRLHVCELRPYNYMKDIDRTHVRCPFNKGFYRGHSIKCEGRIFVRFGSSDEWVKHVDRYCAGNYEKCFMYSRIAKKYEQ